MQTVEFKYQTGTLVILKVNGLTASVAGNHINNSGEKSIYVEFADSTGAIHREYVFENEVSEIKEP